MLRVPFKKCSAVHKVQQKDLHFPTNSFCGGRGAVHFFSFCTTTATTIIIIISSSRRRKRTTKGMNASKERKKERSIKRRWNADGGGDCINHSFLLLLEHYFTAIAAASACASPSYSQRRTRKRSEQHNRGRGRAKTKKTEENCSNRAKKRI